MPPAEQEVEGHYGSADIGARLLAALGAAGEDIEHLERSDLPPFDQLHAGGVASTRDLAA